MGIVSSLKRRRAEMRAEEQAKARSDEIDLHLKEEAKSPFKRCTVLLMSSRESEYKAFAQFKRMQLIHDGCTQEKLAEFRPVIWRILLKNSHTMVRAIRTRDLGHLSRANNANCEYIMNHRIDADNPDFVFLPKFAQAVQDLWAEEIIPVLSDRPFCLPINDNAAYFFAEAQRIVAEDYCPSIEDILHTPQNGLMETLLTCDQLSLRIYQVYGFGLGSNRRKWIHLFEAVTIIILYASLSDYDERAVDASEQTLLEKSLAYFEAIVNSRLFSRTSVVLFLADRDEFSAKLHEVPLAQYFPEYTGGTDANQGVEYILLRFIQLNRAPKNVHAHIAEPSDMHNMHQIFAMIQDILHQNHLHDLGLL